jgi:hypothetical protein
MRFFFIVVFCIVSFFGFWGCSKNKAPEIDFSVHKVPDISNLNHTGTITDHHQLKSTSIDLSTTNVTASITLDGAPFLTPVSAINCKNRVFVQSLAGTRVELDGDGALQFSHKPNASNADNLKSDRAEKVFFKVSLLSEDRAKVEKTIFVDFMAKANLDTRKTYVKGNQFFCDDSGELYIQTIVMAVYEAQPGTGIYLAREHAFQITKFFHLDTKSNVGTLSEKRLVIHFHPQVLKVVNNELFGVGIRLGTMSAFKFSLPDLEPKIFKYFRLHQGDSDHLFSLVQSSEGDFFTSGIWNYQGQRNLELIKLDQNLEALPDIVTDNQGAGRDGLADLILKNRNTFYVYDSIELGDDILLSVMVSGPKGPMKSIVAIDKNNGELDLNFHNTGVESVPGTTLKMDPLKKDDLILLTYTNEKSIRIRLMDKEGKIVKINGETDFLQTKSRPGLIETTVLDENNALVYYIDNNNNDHLNYLKISLKK